MSATETPSATPYQLIFTQALEDYKKKTGRDPTTDVLVIQLSSCTSPEEVTTLLRKQAKQLDAIHKSSFRTRVLEKIEPTIGVIRPLCDTAGKAAGLAFGPGEMIFGAIGILLTIPGNYMKNHEGLIQLLGQMADFLGRLRILIVPDVPFDDAMTKIIVDILVELIRIFTLLTQRASTSDALIPRAKRRFRRILTTISGDKEIESMLNRLDELTKAEDLMTGALARRGIAIVEREQQRQGRMQQAEWYRKWLSVPNSSTNQVTASNARHEDTSMWLVRGQVYEAWKSSGTLLWITGKPGAGKTVICSTVIKALQDSLHFSRSSAFLAYFYCDFRDTTKQSYPALLGSLLMDLSTQSDESENILRELFLKYKNGSQEPEAGDLKQCLKDMLAIPSDDAKYIVVDALDELPNHGVSSSREKTLELMSWLLGLGISGLRLCVTSRPEDDIGQVLKSLASHQVALDEEREHREDIARLIRSIVEKNRKMQGWGGAIKEEVIEALSEKADGMFRYVSCQLDILCEAPISKIRSTLKSLPSTLYTTYESTLGHINREKWEDARRLFQCLSFSTRPLTVEELAEVLAVSVDEEVPTYHDDWRSNDSESVVLSTCPGSFIQVIREDRFSVEAPRRIVQFAHFSVKEFLTSDQLAKSESKTSYFHVLPGLSHVVLAKACLGILLLPNAAASASIQPRLESYATDLWDAHARFEDVSMSLLRAMKLLFDPTKPHFASWAHSREPYQRPPLGNPLYFAALCDLPPIVEHILGSGFHDVNDRGADINASGGLYGSALQGAASNGKLDMVQLLLDRGADVNASGGPYGSALHGAVSNGKLDMVQLLLDRGADINASGGHYGSALQGAAWNGKLDIVLLLLDHGADINVQGGLYGNMLRAAACNWRKEIDIVQFFLDRGFDVNAQGGPFGTALIGASYEGHLDIVRLLLARGADTSIRSERYGTALEATRAGLSWDTTNLREHTAIVELLSNVPQDATYVVPPNGGTGSSTQ